MRVLTLMLMAAVALTATQAAATGQRLQPAKPGAQLKLDAPAAVKPDYVILHADNVGGSSTKLMVQVKNDSAVNSPAGAALKATNKTGVPSGSGVAAIPPIPAGGFVWIPVELNKPARPGARIMVVADYSKKVAEAKENNNRYAFSW